MLYPLGVLIAKRVFTPAARPAIFSALLALALYAITLGGTYVYDDRYIVLADPRIEETSRWGEFWTRDYFNGGADNLYRPLTSMTYALQAAVHGRSQGSAWAYHLLNVLLHAAVSAAVAEFTRRLTRQPAVALLAGLLFAAHPIHVEAVANIVGRAELMCALGVLTALTLFMRPLTNARVIAIWSCLVFALLSKEQGILLPLMMLAAVPARDAPPPGSASQRNNALLLILLLAWTLAAYIYLRENTLGLKFWWERSFLDPSVNPLVQSTGRDRWLMPIVLFGRYVALLVAPIQLLPDYGGDVIGSRVRFTDPYFYLGVAAALLCAAGCIWALRKRAWTVFFCLVSFALVYGMVSNIATLIGTNMAERLMYIPSAFFCILAAVFLCRLPRRAMISLAAIVLVLFSVRTVTYAQRWNHPRQLFEAGIAQEPRSIRLYLLLAEQLERAGDTNAARDVLTSARSVAPDYYRAWQRSAYMALQAGDYDAARTFARRAFDLVPTQEGARLLERIAAASSAATTTTAPATAPSAR